MDAHTNAIGGSAAETSSRAAASAALGPRSVNVFAKIAAIGEGTYGKVYMAKDRENGDIVALKKIRMESEKEGFPITSVREIALLKSLQHANVVDLREVVVGKQRDSVFLVFEYCSHDISALLDDHNVKFSMSEIKRLLIQLLSGVEFLHKNWIIHRDLKLSNLLYSDKGVLKIADFGLARTYQRPQIQYTPAVVTLWYRAPELLFGATSYTPAIDMWSVGCIFAELFTGRPLLPGKTEIEQIDAISRLIGEPNDEIWPGFSSLPLAKVKAMLNQPFSHLREDFSDLGTAGVDLLESLLTYDPARRITASEALQHPFFREMPLPKAESMMPTFPSRHKGERRGASGPGHSQRVTMDKRFGNAFGNTRG